MDSTNNNTDAAAAEMKNIFKMALVHAADSSSSSSSNLHHIICDACNRDEFREYRYKCLICTEYDLCGSCFEKKACTFNHQLNHPMVRFETPDELFGMKFKESEINLEYFKQMFKDTLHTGFQCDGCLMNPLKGLRFKCDTCHEFDLCLKCYENKVNAMKHSATSHTLIVLGVNMSLEIDPSNIEYLKCLGNGAFGTVYKARLRNLNKIVACKIIQINRRDLRVDPTLLYESYLHELQAYRELKGVNILKMFGHCIQKSPSIYNLMIITEYMAKGSMTSLLNNEPNLSYRRRLQIGCDVACGMARIHEHGFIHRDIRPDNILISESYTAKIGDMGIAKLIENNRNTMIGCRPYMPPEFYTGNYDQKLDVFTFGLTFNELFGGTHHFNHPIRIKTKAPVFGKLISECVSLEQTNRPDSAKLKKNIKIYRRVIDETFQKYYPNYAELSLLRKNELFRKFYIHLESIDK